MRNEGLRRVLAALAGAAAVLAAISGNPGGTVAAAGPTVHNTYRSYPVGITGGEPSIGFDRVRNVAVYGETEIRKLSWDDTQPGSPITVTNIDPVQVTSLDPITMVDPYTSRTFTSQLLGACSSTFYSDDAGSTWIPTQGCGADTALDHQTLGAGPFPAPVPTPPAPAYPDVVYYCAQNGFNESCASSVDGGLTYGAGSHIANTPANDPTDPNAQFAAEGGACSALSGHVRVAPDGTAYVPLKGCGGMPTTNNGTNTEFFGGQPALSVSTDLGATWTIRRVPATEVFNGRGGSNMIENPDESDPSVGISRPGGVLYYGWENGHNPSDLKNGDETQAVVAVSHDHGVTWGDPVDVSSRMGVHNVQFPEVIAGDDDRAAFAFLGTATIGDDQTNAFTDIVPRPVWHLYVSTTYDGGVTWSTVDATPNKPVQRGCIDLQGTTIPPAPRVDPCTDGSMGTRQPGHRNLLDFNDITLDNQGRVLIAYTDGCVDLCLTDPSGDHTTDADTVLRQTGGMGLFAAATIPQAASPTPAATVSPTPTTAATSPTPAASVSPTARPPLPNTGGAGPAGIVATLLLLSAVALLLRRRPATSPI